MPRQPLTPFFGGTRTAHTGKGSTQTPAPGAAGGPPSFGNSYPKPVGGGDSVNPLSHPGGGGIALPHGMAPR